LRDELDSSGKTGGAFRCFARRVVAATLTPLAKTTLLDHESRATTAEPEFEGHNLDVFACQTFNL
jgi:hypothetical protein